MVMKSMGKMDDKCTCNWGYGLFSAALKAGGLFVGVRAFALQFLLTGNGIASGASGWQLWNPYLLWYFVAILLMSFGHMCKMKAGACCPAHGGGMCCK